MKDITLHRKTTAWAMLAGIGFFTFAMISCGPAGGQAGSESEAKPGTEGTELQNQLRPVLASLTQSATAFTFTARPPWNPTTIFPVPFRSWLPPAETLEKAGSLPGDQRPVTSPPYPIAENPLSPPDVSLPEPLTLPARDLAQSVSPDPARITVWIATSPAPETRGRPPAWDRPQLATDPTTEVTRAFPVDAPTGLRETPPPFMRLTIPDPTEQITIAELRTPPPEIDPPVTPFTRPANLWPASPAPGK